MMSYKNVKYWIFWYLLSSCENYKNLHAGIIVNISLFFRFFPASIIIWLFRNAVAKNNAPNKSGKRYELPPPPQPHPQLQLRLYPLESEIKIFL